MIYFLIILISFSATMLGSLVGIGGGVIIKPTLDSIELFPPSQIAIYSTVTVFAMATTSLIKNLAKGVKIDIALGLKIFIGASLGGILGSSLLDSIGSYINSESNVTIIQSIILIICLLLSMTFIRFKDKLSFPALNFGILPILLGVLLGAIASFLSIGGGPINVAFLAVFIGLSLKEAVLYSILTIFFSQGVNITILASNGKFQDIDFVILTLMSSSAVLGGLIGSKIGHNINERLLRKIYYLSLLGIILLNIYVIFVNT